MKTSKKYLFFVFLMFIIAGCATATPHQLSSLPMGMSKQDVFTSLGNRHLLKRSSSQVKGVDVETWEYSSYQPFSPYANKLNGNVIYWLQFANDKLVFYGFPGDYGSGVNQNINLNIKEH